MVRNFETAKLFIASPDLTNTALLLLLCAAALVSVKKMPAASQDPFSPLHTRQMRGAAILLIMLGHVWVHVAHQAPSIILSGYGVAFFFLLSGFGLSVSAREHHRAITPFLLRRLRRVMVPYWCTTAIFLALDAALLGKTCSPATIILTGMGINMTEATTHIDYVRWYITLQLIWYAIFCVTVLRLPGRRSLVWMGICAVVIFFFDYYVTRQGWAHIFAFPLGCALGLHSEQIRTALEKHRGLFLSGACAAVLWVLFYKAAIALPASKQLPQILCKLIDEANGVLCAAGAGILIAGLGQRGLMSRFLLVCGTFSYELFLLHGPLLIKYNPVFGSAGNAPFIAQYLLFLALLICLAWLFHRFLLLMPGARAADTHIR